MEKYINTTGWFYGNKVSDYGKEQGYIDYACLAKAFNHVMANDIINATNFIDCDWDIYCGNDYDEETDEYIEFYQYFIIDGNGAEILQRYTEECVYYCEKLDMYVWAVAHWGTSWDYVLTNIPCRSI